MTYIGNEYLVNERLKDYYREWKAKIAYVYGMKYQKDLPIWEMKTQDLYRDRV